MNSLNKKEAPVRGDGVSQPLLSVIKYIIRNYSSIIYRFFLYISKDAVAARHQVLKIIIFLR